MQSLGRPAVRELLQRLVGIDVDSPERFVLKPGAGAASLAAATSALLPLQPPASAPWQLHGCHGA